MEVVVAVAVVAEMATIVVMEAAVKETVERVAIVVVAEDVAKFLRWLHHSFKAVFSLRK